MTSHPQISIKNNNGSALFLILIAVVLFAALTYAITQSNRGNANNFSREAASLEANRILSYGNDMRYAVNKLLLKGCSDTEITINDSNPACNIYGANGGGVAILRLYDLMTPASVSATFTYMRNNVEFGSGWMFGRMSILNVGTDGASANNSELMWIMPYIKKETCIRLNERVGVTNPSGNPPISWIDAGGGWNGTYVATTVINTLQLQGKETYCMESNSTSGLYWFVQVLIAR